MAMTRAEVRSLTAIAVLAIVLVVAGVSTWQAAQQQQNAATAKPAGPVPRLTDGKPDMTGVWAPAPGGGDGLAELEKLYNQKAQARIQQLGEADDPLLRCLPYGVPRAVVSSPWPFQIVQRQGMMVVLTEYYHAFRLVPTDGSPHAADVLPTYFGDSAGRWEGDTLAVDGTGFNDKTWLAGTGTFHTDALHTIERFTRVDKDQINYEVTMEDPNVFTKPWVLRSTLMLREGTRLQEMVCAENNIDPERYEKLLKDGVKFTR